METPFVGPFTSQIISCICLQLYLKQVTTQQLARGHQWIFKIFHLTFVCCNITKNCRNGSWNTTFWSLELSFLKESISAKCCCTISLTFLKCQNSASEYFFMSEVPFLILQKVNPFYLEFWISKHEHPK
jgi:hypothetical protein